MSGDSGVESSVGGSITDMALGVSLTEVIEAVAVGNLKSIAEQPAMLSNLVYSNVVANVNMTQQNAVANQQAMNELGISIVADACKLVSSGSDNKKVDDIAAPVVKTPLN